MRRPLLAMGVVLVGFAAAAYYAGNSGDGLSLRASLQGVQAEFDRLNIDFGATPVGVGASSSVVLTNRGDKPLTLAALGNQGAFRSRRGDVVIEPGGAAMFTFEFLPERPGPYEARFEAMSDAGRIGVLSMRGVALAPPRISIEPRALDFGPVALGEERVTPIKISNLGDGELRVSGLGSVGRFVFSESSLDIAPGEHAVVRVSFAPKRVGPSRAQLMVLSNDPDRPGAGLSVEGFGTERGVAPVIDIRPSKLSFGKVAPGSKARRHVEIRNVSRDPLTITSVLAHGPFSIATRSRTIAPGGFVRLPVTLSPQNGNAEIRGALSIFSNDPSAGEVLIAVDAEITDTAPIREVATSTSTQSSSGSAAGSRTLFGALVDALSGEGSAAGGAGAGATAGAAEAGSAETGSDTPDVAAPAAGGFEIEDGSYLNLGSNVEHLSTPNIEAASYDSQSGTITLEGLQLPEVNGALGQYYSFSKADVVAQVSETGEVTATVPVQVYDKFGTATDVDLHFTTDTAVAWFDGIEIATAGSPLSGGSLTLVALERVSGGALDGQALQLNLNVKVE